MKTPVRTKADIAAWCMDYVAKSLDVPCEKIDLNMEFNRLGLDSAMATDFMIDLEDWARIKINSEALFDYPTIAKLSEYVAGLYARPSTPP